MRLVLASASPRRADLLRAAGFAFEVCAVDVDERPQSGETPADYVRRLAAEKSAAAMANPKVGAAPAITVLGADTAVVVDGEILGKPRNDEDAARMLGRLSGCSHQVMTGVSLRAAAVALTRVEVTTVQFAALSAEDIAWYVASGEGRDKAGAYAIQGLAARFIPSIVGSYSNVVGLPIACVWHLMREIAVGNAEKAGP